MAWWDDKSYDLGFDSKLDSSWLDEYDGGVYVPDTSNWNLQEWAPRPEPQFNFGTQPPAPYVPAPVIPDVIASRGMYDPGTEADPAAMYTGPESQVNPVTGTLANIGRSVGAYAAANPKDVLGMATGAGMGLYGLLQPEGRVSRPDLSQLAAARAALEAQAAKTSRVNDPVYEAAMRNMQRELDQPGGYDPRLAEERKQLRAQREAYYQSRGLLGSDIANRELADFDRQTTSLLEDDAARRSQTRMGTYNVAAGAANPEQTSRTFSQLANLGIQGAQMETGVNTQNATLQEQRRNALLNTGGQIFGRSVATNPLAGDYDPRTGQKRTSAWG